MIQLQQIQNLLAQNPQMLQELENTIENSELGQDFDALIEQAVQQLDGDSATSTELKQALRQYLAPQDKGITVALNTTPQDSKITVTEGDDLQIDQESLAQPLSLDQGPTEDSYLLHDVWIKPIPASKIQELNNKLEQLEFANPFEQQELIATAVDNEPVQVPNALNAIIQATTSSTQTSQASVAVPTTPMPEQGHVAKTLQFNQPTLDKSDTIVLKTDQGVVDDKLQGDLKNTTLNDDQQFFNKTLMNQQEEMPLSKKMMQALELASKNPKPLSQELSGLSQTSPAAAQATTHTQAQALSRPLEGASQTQTMFQEHIPVPTSNKQWHQAFQEKMIMLAGRGIQSALIHIDPPELGPIEVHINMDGDGASLNFHTQHGAVRDLIESQVQRLQKDFEAQGITLTDVSVSDYSHGEYAQQNHSASPKGYEASMTQDLEVTQPRQDHDGLLDIYV